MYVLFRYLDSNNVVNMLALYKVAIRFGGMLI